MSFWAIFPVSAVIAGPLCTLWCWSIKPAGPQQSWCNLFWHWSAFRQRANSTGLKHWPHQFSALCPSCSSVEICYLNVLSSHADSSSSHTRAFCSEGAVTCVISVLKHSISTTLQGTALFVPSEFGTEWAWTKVLKGTGLNSLLPVFPEITRVDRYLCLNV